MQKTLRNSTCLVFLNMISNSCTNVHYQLWWWPRTETEKAPGEHTRNNYRCSTWIAGSIMNQSWILCVANWRETPNSEPIVHNFNKKFTVFWYSHFQKFCCLPGLNIDLKSILKKMTKSLNHKKELKKI